MPVQASNNLNIYLLNVGQADTTIIKTPEGKIIVIDAVAPEKLRTLLMDLGLQADENIEELVITHPHRDHYSAANSLVNYFNVGSVSLAPSWHEKGWGTNQYKELINTIDSKSINIRFVSGYSRIYPDHFIVIQNNNPVVREDVPYLELLGPPNSLLMNLEGKEGYGANHLSIMARVTWQKFSVVFAADAQMENWGHFDREGMLEKKCKVLKAAHHGSKNGTQWERFWRLEPRFVIVSSEKDGRDHIPDAIGSAILKEYYESYKKPLVIMTEDTGTVEIEVTPNGSYKVHRFKDPKDENVQFTKRTVLNRGNNPTNWGNLLKTRLSQP
jgi:competence protein ComEC